MSVGVNRTTDLMQPERTRRVALRPELPAVVAAVMPGSLSDEIGIEPGDRIIEINGRPLRDVLDFHFYAADEAVTLVVERGHELVTCEVERDLDEQWGLEFADPTFDAQRHYLLAYELQRRFFVRNEQGDIQRFRNLASAIYRSDPKFKPLRDATHNQLSAALLPRLRAYRDRVKGGARGSLEELISEIEKLTSIGESVPECGRPGSDRVVTASSIAISWRGVS